MARFFLCWHSTLPVFFFVRPAEKLSCGKDENAVKALKSFTFEDIRSIMVEGENPANLDNFDNANRTRNTVQLSREMTTSNGCHVTLAFPLKGRAGVRRKIAEMFVASMEKGMDAT